MFIWLRFCRSVRVVLLAAIAVFAFLAIAPVLRAADDKQEFDNYKIRADLFWFYSNPSGNFQGTGGERCYRHRQRPAVQQLFHV